MQPVAMLNESDEDLLAGFQMQTPGRSRPQPSKPHTPTGSGGASWQHPGALAQESDAYYRGLLAAAESRVLDERAKGKQREMELREDIVKEQALGTRAGEQRIKELLESFRKEGEHTVAANEALRTTQLANVRQEAAAETAERDAKISQLQSEVAELKRELRTAQRRHQDEKRELLALRNNQLRLESGKRSQEGDLVTRAMQGLAEYEQAVRRSEAENTQRLKEYMDSFTVEWLQRTEEFDRSKATFESELLRKALQVVREHETEVDGREQAVKDRASDVVQLQSAARAEQERRLLDQYEGFKNEYKEKLDKDFQSRCELFDKGLDMREQQLMEKVAEAGRQLARVTDDSQVQLEQERVSALRDAMQQVNELREKMLADLRRRQEELVADCQQRREALQEELAAVERKRTAEVSALREQLSTAMEDADRVLANMEGRLSARDAELHTKYLGQLEAGAQVRVEEALAHKERVEREYHSMVDELKQVQAAELRRMADEFLEKRDRDGAESLRREQELRALFETKQQRFEETLQQRYSRQIQGHEENESALHSALSCIRGEIAELQRQLREQQQQHAAREAALQQRCASMQRAVGCARQSVEEELRQRSEKWLDSALAGAFSSRGDAGEVAALRQQLASQAAAHAAELAKSGERWGQERESIREQHTKRVAEEQAKTAKLEAELMDRIAAMRIELHAEARRQQQELSRSGEEQRRELQQEQHDAAVRLRREKAEFEAREHDAQQARWERINRELKEQCDSALAEQEQRVALRVAELDRREADLREQKLLEARRLMDERRKTEAEVWAARAEAEEELRKDFDRRLEAERDLLKEEVSAIRRRAEEQERQLEAARAELSGRSAQERLELEAELRAKHDELAEKLQERHRDEMAARDSDERQRDTAAKQRHEAEVAELRSEWRSECARLRREAEDARTARDSTEAARADRLAAELETVRAAAASDRAAWQRQAESQRTAQQSELASMRDTVEAERRRLQEEHRALEADLRQQVRDKKAAVELEGQMRIQAETDALRQRELKMMADAGTDKAEAERRAREYAQELVDARAVQWQDLEEHRRRAAATIVDGVKGVLAERDAELAAKSMRFEEDLRTRVADALREERARAEDKTARELAVAAAKDEVQQLTRQLAIPPSSGADVEEWEARMDQLRSQLSADFEQERERLLSQADRDRQEQEQLHEKRAADLRAACDASMEELRKEHAREREAMHQQLLRKDEDAARSHVALGSEASVHLEEQLKELRATYERRQRERDEAHAERVDELTRRGGAQEQRLRQHHDSLLREAERAHTAAVAERDNERRLRERQHEQELSALRQQLDLARIGGDGTADEGVARKLTELTKRLNQEKTEMVASLERERAAREAADRARAHNQAEVERLNTSMAQYKLDVHKELVAKFEQLFSAVQHKARADRESYARQLLEEEERRLALGLARSKAGEPAGGLVSGDPQVCEALTRQAGRLAQLWRTLETRDGERANLADAVLVRMVTRGALLGGAVESPCASPPRTPHTQQPLRTTDVVVALTEEISNEIRRIEAQLPLFEVVARREFVLDQLAEMRGQGGEKAAGLKRELSRLSAQLVQELRTYEATYRAHFYYKDARYLHVVERDTESFS
eukprot:TRINITY_DN5929_c0_g1_i2.p1 TRINITY_DN5929_c0_g1~~TRINITY_DN5929_c0_g1_i2.p1  ORF type:complete len:1630 (+),score=773.10 TRINITY_DN5929_c0_g1_i2:33-4922(+)